MPFGSTLCDVNLFFMKRNFQGEVEAPSGSGLLLRAAVHVRAQSLQSGSGGPFRCCRGGASRPPTDQQQRAQHPAQT